MTSLMFNYDKIMAALMASDGYSSRLSLNFYD